MEKQRKAVIRKQLEQYIRRAGSKNKAATMLGVAASTIGLILTGHDNKVSDEMWQQLSNATRPVLDEWTAVETLPYCEIRGVIERSQLGKEVTWVVAPAGSGKTTTAKIYAEHDGNAVYILCSEDMRQRDFLNAILRALGHKNDMQTTLRGTLEYIIEILAKRKDVVLIFDEADKLLDSIFLYFVTIYNHLEGRVGIVFLSTNYIERRLRSGLQNNKRGYNELHSRIGRRFYTPEHIYAGDVSVICRANGITDEADIRRVIKDAEEYDFDLRRVRKCIMKIKNA